MKEFNWRGQMITDYDVIIVGGGPTGIALGIELGLHDIRTLILEKHKTPLLSPRAMSLNTRSMEFFRRWKISEQLKQEILLPPDYPIRGVWCSKLNGTTYTTVSSNDLITDDISPERGIRIPLWLTEKVLRKRLEDFPSVNFLKEYTVIDLTFDTHNINVVANHGKETTFTAPFVVGCDGANSITRVKAGIPFEALAPSSRVINIVFEAKDFERLITVDQGFLYYLLESDTPGAIGPVDLKQGIWYAQIRDNSQIDKIEDLDLSTLLDNMAGFSFKKHILQAHFWQMHIQMAQAFSRDNRIFLVGDSAHAFVPTGGFGLNTGLGDATNLGWKLAQVIKGRARKSLLNSYEEERRPVCLNNLTLAQKNADDLMSLRKKYNPQENPEAFAKANAKLANQYVSALDATLGYRYGICQQIERTQQKPYHSIVAAGYFLAHRWIDGNLSIYDKLSAAHWTLIVSGQVPEDELKRFSDFNLDVLKLPKDTYPFYYVLIRPDWHIAYVSDHFIIMHILNVISQNGRI